MIAAAMSGDFVALSAELKKIKGYKTWEPRQFPEIFDENDNIATDLVESRKCWRRFFNELLTGYEATFMSLLVKDRHEKVQKAQDLRDIERHFDCVYSRLEISRKNK